MYAIHEIGLEIASLAADYVRQHELSHGVDPIDALIAVTAGGTELARFNLKHFSMFRGQKRPYEP